MTTCRPASVLLLIYEFLYEFSGNIFISFYAPLKDPVLLNSPRIPGSIPPYSPRIPGSIPTYSPPPQIPGSIPPYSPPPRSPGSFPPNSPRIPGSIRPVSGGLLRPLRTVPSPGSDPQTLQWNRRPAHLNRTLDKVGYISK